MRLFFNLLVIALFSLSACQKKTDIAYVEKKCRENSKFQLKGLKEADETVIKEKIINFCTNKLAVCSPSEIDIISRYYGQDYAKSDVAQKISKVCYKGVLELGTGLQAELDNASVNI